MPNWCSNGLRVSHADPAALERVREAFVNARLLAEFIPEPQADAANLDWYFWRRANWGTKWDVGGSDFVIDHVGDHLQCYFDSAWTPPIPLFERLTELGYTVNATYYEPGVGFVGRWTSEDGDDCYEIELTAEAIAELPQDLVDEYGIEPWDDDDEEA